MFKLSRFLSTAVSRVTLTIEQENRKTRIIRPCSRTVELPASLSMAKCFFFLSFYLGGQNFVFSAPFPGEEIPDYVQRTWSNYQSFYGKVL